MSTQAAKSAAVSRRTFIAGSGLTFAITLVPGVFKMGEALAADAPRAVGAWVTIGTDNSIVISSPAAEMGQGTMTGLLQLFADELDADWTKVSARAVPADGATYGNAGGALTTVGSNGVRGHFDKMRLQGAAVRKVLMQAAAEQWGGVPLTELTTLASVVTHTPSGRKLTYGEIAAFAKVPATMPVIDKAELKPTAKYNIVGKPLARLDVPAKTNGTAMFGMDVRLPGMVYATILRTPVEGNTVVTVDDTAAMRIPGMLKVVKLTDSVGLVGTSVEAVFAARNAVRVTWTSNDFSKYNSEKALTEFASDAKDLARKGASVFKAGDVDKTFAEAAKVIKSDYTTDYVYHAGMEPINLTAMVSPARDAAEIWIGTQSQTGVQNGAAAFLKIPAKQVTVNQYFLGGGFGRRSGADMVNDALAMSIEMGKPVKVIWTRETDIKAAKLRPMTAHHLEAALDASGNVTGWRHRIAAEAVSGYPDPSRFNTTTGLDGLVTNGARIDYTIANQSTEYLREVRGAPLAAWRAIGAGHNKFAIEGFMDEIAAAQKLDPVELRLKYLKDPRGVAIVKAVAEMSGWGTKSPEGRARGFALGFNVASWTAMVAEVSINKPTGLIRVHKVWSAIDAGLALNPEMIRQQCESCVIFGIGAALRERITFTNGQIDQSNLFDYRVARMSDMPDIETRVLVTDNAPGGVGEAVLPNLAPAIAQGVFALTNARLKSLPFTPQRVRAALNGAAAV